MYLQAKFENTVMLINLGQDSQNINDLVRMIEENAVFVKENYNELCLLNPEIQIKLGDEVKFEKTGYSGGEHNLLINMGEKSNKVGIVEATTQAFIDLAEINKKHALSLEKMKKEIDGYKAKITMLEQEIENMQVGSCDEE